MARPRRSQETREKLLHHGVDLLSERGYHGTGLKELLDDLQVPKGSFYNYFKSKEDFGAEVVRYYSRTLLEQSFPVLDDEEGDALEALSDFFRQVANGHQLKHVGCLVGNLGAELGGDYEHIRGAMAEALHAWRDRFERAVSRGQQQGSIRRDLSSETLADFLLNGFEGSLLRMRIEQSTEPITQFSSLTLDEFFAPR